MSYNYFINFFFTSLISIERSYLFSIQDTNLILLTCFTQNRFQNSSALCVSAHPSSSSPLSLTLALESHSTAYGFPFLPYTQTQPPVTAVIVLSCRGVAIPDSYQIPERPAQNHPAHSPGLYAQTLNLRDSQQFNKYFLRTDTRQSSG